MPLIRLAGLFVAVGCTADTSSSDRPLPEPYIPPYADVVPNSVQGLPDSSTGDVADGEVEVSAEVVEPEDALVPEEDTCIVTGLDVVTCF